MFVFFFSALPLITTFHDTYRLFCRLHISPTDDISDSEKIFFPLTSGWMNTGKAHLSSVNSIIYNEYPNLGNEYNTMIIRE